MVQYDSLDITTSSSQLNCLNNLKFSIPLPTPEDPGTESSLQAIATVVNSDAPTAVSVSALSSLATLKKRLREIEKTARSVN